MRIGIVKFVAQYVVDLDNPDMVDEAKSCVYEDVMNAAKYDEVGTWIATEFADDKTADDIPEFLRSEF